VHRAERACEQGHGYCSLLGPLQVRIDDQPVEIGGARLRALLARLALSPGRTVPVDGLVDDLWGSEPPGGAANALQSLVSRLRRTLGRTDLITSTAAGYALTADTDVQEFQQLVGAGMLAEALALWRGPALADISDAPFAEPEAHRLEELRLAATEDWIEAELAAGRHAELIAELDGLVAAHPLRERFRGQYITALYRVGRQADALRSYEDARRYLADELGVDPSPQLQAVHVAVLRGEAATAESASTNLRAQLTSFVGRDRDMAAITRLLKHSRLVTLVGPGGAGKTRLAGEVGAALQSQSPDGVWMVELASVTNPGDVVQATLSALRLRERSLLDTTSDARDAGAKLVAALSGSTALLIVDNCEHLINAAADLVDMLLAGCPNLRVIATSREPLSITGEALHPVPSLELPDSAESATHAAAVRLFAERAVAVRPDFAIDDWTDEVVEICRRLDGMPLAIELAAARLRVLTPAELGARLDDRFRLLTGGSRTALPRHQTLRAVVDWSWDLLEKQERMLTRRLSVFPGGITLATVEAICAGSDLPADEVLELIAALVDKSLLQTAGNGRYRMLETIRAYGHEQLVATDELIEIQAAHAAYYLDLVERADPKLRSREQLRWLNELIAEHDNILAALRFYVDRGNADGAARMAASLLWFWTLRGMRDEARLWLNAALDVPGEAAPIARATCYGGRAMMVGGNGAQVEAKWSLGRALRIVHTNPELVHDHPMSAMLEVIASIAIPTRMSRVRPALENARRHSDPWTRAAALMAYGHWAENQGRATDAERDFRLALEEFREVGDRWGLASTMESVAQIGELRGDLRAVIEIEEEALQLLKELEAFEDLAQALCILARQQARIGELDSATINVERASELAHRYSDVETRLWVEATAGEIDRRRGDLAAARRRADAVLAGTESANFFPSQLRAVFLVAVAFLDLAEGKPDDARSHGIEAIGIGAEHHDQGAVASAIDVLGCTEIAEGNTERAAVLFGIAEGTRGLPDLGDPDVVMAREKCRTELGAADYQNAYDRGVAMSYDTAIEFVR
jgi:predicted ATPase/DNA-binding SARP family transcriptional activator